MSRSNKVVWDQSDKIKVASAVKAFIASGSEISIKKFNDLVKENMTEDKQRVIASWTAVPWLAEMVGAIPNPGLVVKRRSKADANLPEDVMDHPIDSIKLTGHIKACLHASGINTVRDLVTKREEEILAIRQLGGKAISLIKTGLLAKDPSLKIGMEIKAEAPNVIVEDLQPAKPQEPVSMDTLADTLVYIMTPYLKELASKVVNGSIDVFQGEVTKQLVSRTLPQEHSHTTYAIDQSKVAKKKVVVVGMENREAARLEEEFGKVFTLRVYNHTKSLDTLRNVLPTADVVLIPTNYVNHSATDMVKARYHGELIRFTGGLTMVRSKLRELIQKDHQ